MTRSSIRLVKFFIVLLVGLIAREYANYFYYAEGGAPLIVYSLENRPYVYRVLVPWLAYALTALGLSPETALHFVIVCTAIGFLYALVYLFKSFKRRS